MQVQKGPVDYSYPQYQSQPSTGKGPDPYSYTYRDMPDNEEVEDGRLRATFTALHFELIKMLAPQGTEDNPARTCRDIFRCHPQKESGMYWIDPNEGSPDDKFQVYCNKKTLESCIEASPDTAQNGTWYTGEPGHRLFSDMDDGFEFTYPVNTIQLTFLRLLTNQARQTVTYHCKNSVAAYDAEARNMDMAMRLITTTEAELSADGKSTFRYDIIKDGCQRRTGNWEKTVLEYKTKKNTRLPIVNVAPADIGGADQEFGLEIGPVCFS
ncbi:collagen alpha-1(II) chain-like [Amphiura filiformis]|uniref:collagen alpha-1(II) chain-like n=1 Tax=Amphiura filiformis TaxID=82378 RepID=UPI003B21EDB1